MLFLVRIPLASVFISVHYLLNQLMDLVTLALFSRSQQHSDVQNMVSVRYRLNKWMDFGQTCINTLLGGGEAFIRFW